MLYKGFTCHLSALEGVPKNILEDKWRTFMLNIYDIPLLLFSENDQQGRTPA